jgi:cysteine-S-conjugate beta-lyase
MPLAAPEIADRLVMMTATTKTFNIAGAHTGNVIIARPGLRARFRKTLMAGLGISPNSFGLEMAGAYSPEGAAWVDALCAYLDGNRRLFEAGVAPFPGAGHAAAGDLSGMGRFRRHRHGRGRDARRIEGRPGSR